MNSLKKTETAFFCKHSSHYKSMHRFDELWDPTICKQKLSSVALFLHHLVCGKHSIFFFFWRMNKVYQVLSLTRGMYPNLLMSSAEQEKKEELFNNLSFTCCKIAVGSSALCRNSIKKSRKLWPAIFVSHVYNPFFKSNTKL